MIKQKFRKFDNFVFDLDGTVWHWVNLVFGAHKVFKELYKQDKNVLFVTDNVALTLDGFAQKLYRMGIDAEESQIHSPTRVAMKIFKKKRVLCLTEDGIKTDLKNAGVKVVHNNANVVLTADFADYRLRSLAKAYSTIKNGGKLYKTAVGGMWAPWGKYVPSAAGVSTSIEMITKRPGELIGKPSKYMVSLIKKLRLDPKKTAMFGDRIGSDIVFGNKLGFKTGFVLTGRDKIKDVPEFDGGKPTWIMKSIKDIVS